MYKYTHFLYMTTVGIDPSLNSTGVCIIKYDDDMNVIDERYFIVKPNKLTRRETDAQNKNENFNYVLYDKQDLKQYNENNHVHEYHKTCNIINVTRELKRLIDDNVDDEHVIIVQEGISYGSSIRTKSIYDLAGLNYLIRNLFIDDDRFELYVCPPSNIKKFASGNGNCKKELMIQLFKSIHPDFDVPKLDDIADAYFMARYAYELKKEQSR